MTPPNLSEIAQRLDQAEKILLGLDFDGTLVPIRFTPDEVVLSDDVRALLIRLAQLPQVTVMIVSGRSLADVAGRVDIAGLIYAGNHGLEIEGPGLSFVEATAASMIDRLQKLTVRTKSLLEDVPGVLVEAKRLTSSIHYRNVPPERWEVLASMVQELVSSDPDHFVLTSGHRVWEIRPRVLWHKGKALERVLQDLGDSAKRLVFYFGDDCTDEDAFASLPEDVTFRIGDATQPTQVRYRLADPLAVERFLGWLVERLSPLEESSWTRDSYT